MAVAIFRDLQAEAVTVRLVAFSARFMVDHANGIMYAFSANRQDISRGTAPIENPARLESRDQLLSTSLLVGQTSSGSTTVCTNGQRQGTERTTTC